MNINEFNYLLQSYKDKEITFYSSIEVLREKIHILPLSIHSKFTEVTTDSYWIIHPRVT